MKHDPATIGEAVDYLVWRDEVGMAAVVAELAADAEALRAEVDRLRSAIRRHRDERGDDRCWLDDIRLYNALGEGPADCTLPPKCEFLESCGRYWEKRQSPGEKIASAAGKMTIGQLEREADRLRAELAACREALRVTDDPALAGAAVTGRVDAVAGRIVGALCWTRHVDDSTDDSRRIAARYGELKRELPFDEAERRAKREFVASVIGEAVRPPRPE